MSTFPKFYAKAEVTKLREYRKSYGSPETMNLTFIVENENSIDCYMNGMFYRTFRKGTKLLVDWKGEEITERSFKIRMTKLRKVEALKSAERKERLEQERKEQLAAQLREEQEIEDAYDLLQPHISPYFADIIASRELVGPEKSRTQNAIFQDILKDAGIESIQHYWRVWKRIGQEIR